MPDPFLTSCPLCGEPKVRALVAFSELVFGRCVACGLIYKREQQPGLGCGYEQAYFDKGRAQYMRRFAHRVRKSRSDLRDALELVPHARALLDVGCAGGYVLAAAKEMGLEATGLDCSQAAVDVCASRGLQAVAGSFEEMPFADGTFDIVVAKHTLEHMRQPLAALGEARRVLRPGGALLVVVPDAEYWKRYAAPRRGRYFHPEHGGWQHHVYFDERTLRLACGRAQLAPLTTSKALLRRRLGNRASVWEGLRFFGLAISQQIARLTHLRHEIRVIARSASSMQAPRSARRTGRVIGDLLEGEERAVVEEALLKAPELVLSLQVRLLLHGDHRPELSAEEQQQKLEDRLSALARGTLKRYVFAIDTAAGERIIKISEVNTLGKRLAGLAQRSNARSEHVAQVRAEALGIAASKTAGFLEWRHGPGLLRSCQVQQPLQRELLPISSLLATELARFGDAAAAPLGAAIAHMHELRFFHADLKAYHAFPSIIDHGPDGLARYRLLWLDLGRAGFALSGRQRVINLYQVFRFVLPPREPLQEIFIEQYCRDTGWHAARPSVALAKVRRLLAYKLRTHPSPML